MLPSLESLQTWLNRVSRDVLRLGTREHLIAARIRDEAVAQGWSQRTLGDALASALATDRDTWRELRRVFDAEFAPPAAPVPAHFPRLLAGLLSIGVLVVALLLGLCGRAPGPRPDLGMPDLPATDTADLGGSGLRPPAADLGCYRQPVPQPDGGVTSKTREERVLVQPLHLRDSLLWGLGMLVAGTLAMLLLRLQSYLRRRLAEQWEQEQVEAQHRKQREEAQEAEGNEKRRQQVRAALESGQPTRPSYQVELQPPFGPDVVEDSAALLGRAYLSQSGSELDIEGTLHATFERGGAARPVFLPRREVRELCVLYDDTTTRPYLPGFLKLVERWARLGVRLSLYRFSRHPTTLTPAQVSSGAGTPSGTPIELADLLRQHEGCSLLLFANRLVVRTPTRELDWVRTLRQAPVCAWLDPDPRLDSERDDDTRTYLELLPRHLPRFPLTADGLLAAARYLGSPAEGARPPPWSPPPALSDAQLGLSVDLWLAVGALVPDAALNQLEAVRQTLLKEALPDPRSIARLVERLTQLLGPSYSPSKATIELSKTLRLRLLGKLLLHDRALFRRACALFLQTLAEAPRLQPGESPSLLHDETAARRAWYGAGIALCDGLPTDGLLEAQLGRASHQFIRESIELLTQLSTQLAEGPDADSVQEVVARPPVLTWPAARIPRLLWQSALIAALLPLLLWVSLRSVKTWPGRTVAVTTTYQPAQKAQPDEQVICPNRPQVTEPRPEVVAVAPLPVAAEIKKPTAETMLRPPPMPSLFPDMAPAAPVDLATPPANLAMTPTPAPGADDGCLSDTLCRTAYDKAVTLFESGKFWEALPSFQEAYRRRPMPWLLINIGRTAHRLGRPEEAISYYERYEKAETDPDPETQERLNKYMEQAKALLATMPSAALRPLMVPIPSGRFKMGSPEWQGESDERPRHEVHITVPFLLSATEVTQTQYQAVMGNNPSHFADAADSPNRPVERVTWLDAVRYCNKLSQREGQESCYVITGDRVEWPKWQGCTGYRLPTEAEWEYAARAGEGWEYAGSDNLDEVAWYRDNSGGRTHIAGTWLKKTNAWKLSDMSGNVWEWVWDWYRDSYAGADSTDPMGPGVGRYRVLRGGSFVLAAVNARVADRDRGTPSEHNRIIGFRIARSNP